MDIISQAQIVIKKKNMYTKSYYKCKMKKIKINIYFEINLFFIYIVNLFIL